MTTLKPVLCVGCTVIDFVTISASYPQEDTDRRCLDGFWARGGNASNVSTVLRLLDTRVEFFGMLSSSPAFRVLLEDLTQRQIATQHCPTTSKDPPFSSVIIAQDKATRTIIHCNKNYPYVSALDFSKIDLSRYGWVHFEARQAAETVKMMRMVQAYNETCDPQARLIVSLDFESTFEQNLPLCGLCNYLVFSKELATQRGWSTARDACQQLLFLITQSSRTSPSIICPWGSAGAVCLDSSGNFAEIRAHEPPQVVDTLGAGDSFLAGFIHATYGLQQELQVAVDFANRVAGHKISKFGYDHIADFKFSVEKK
ncbi:CG7328 [Drosophila busckii]|uniref:CG7328 n=1 Tax=Drosophila busckii TaxID=30019 RepID=A0A0M5J680_DROBS|nr:ketohexokinase [Drosophila busckii]ALC49281.1 CG7328 [Drosophila busckii]